MSSLPPNLTHREASAVLRMLDPQVRQGSGPVRLDASALQTFDSSAIAVLFECRRRAEAAGRILVVESMPEGLTGLARLYGVEDLLPATQPAQDQPAA